MYIPCCYWRNIGDFKLSYQYACCCCDCSLHCHGYSWYHCFCPCGVLPLWLCTCQMEPQPRLGWRAFRDPNFQFQPKPSPGAHVDLNGDSSVQVQGPPPPNYKSGDGLMNKTTVPSFAEIFALKIPQLRGQSCNIPRAQELLALPWAAHL